MKLLKTTLLLFLFVPVGCASLKDFQEMSPDGRAEYVCERNAEVESLESQIDFLAAQADEAEDAIAVGYRLREFCKEVPLVTSTEEVCETDKDGKKICKTKSNVSREVVCEQQAVPIDGEFERKRIKENRAAIRRLDADADRAYTRCYDRVRPMSAEEAFEYYRASRSGF